jgi:D-arabinose 1-dehydrogenase-like Zn-dependent alcohol dehydrogenase
MAATQKDIPPCGENEYREVAWGTKFLGGKIEPFYVNRGKVGDYDVKIDMHYCGICHTDCHMGLGEMPGGIFPMV